MTYIFGISDYAYLVGRFLVSSDAYDFGGYVVDDDYYCATEFNGQKVQKLSTFLGSPRFLESEIFIAVGYRSMRSRKDVFDRLLKLGCRTCSYVSPDSSVDDTARLGKNVIVMPGVVIEPGVSIADNVIVWSNATVCHDSDIGSHTFIAANTTLGGNVSVGTLCFLGFSSTVIQGVSVADETLLGAMSLLLFDSKEYSRYIGVPAVPISLHEETGICIL